MLTTTSVSGLLSRTPLFQGLAPGQLDALSRGCRFVSLDRDEAAFHQGSPTRGFFMVLRGQMQLTVSTADGARKVVEIIREGESFGAAILFEGRDAPATATALAATELLVVSGTAVFGLLDRDPAFARRILANMAGRLHRLLQDVKSYSFHLRNEARPGSKLIVRGPLGAFGLNETGLRPRWLVAGGTGLAPMLSMARHMVEWQEPHPVRLILGVNEEEEVFGLSEMRELAAEAPAISAVGGLPGFEFEVCVWRPSDTWRGSVETPADLVRSGLKSEDVLPDLYVCGPPTLIDSVLEAAVEGGVAEENVFWERFLPS